MEWRKSRGRIAERVEGGNELSRREAGNVAVLGAGV